VFTSLSDRLTATFKNLRSKGRLTESDVNKTVRDIRLALLDADVALPVVKEFTHAVRERALGAEVSEALNPAQQVVKIVNEELVGILGGETRKLRSPRTRRPSSCSPASRVGQDDLGRQALEVAQGPGAHAAARGRRPPAPQRRHPARGRR
jgi:signal recognition particle GTPase